MTLSWTCSCQHFLGCGDPWHYHSYQCLFSSGSCEWVYVSSKEQLHLQVHRNSNAIWLFPYIATCVLVCSSHCAQIFCILKFPVPISLDSSAHVQSVYIQQCIHTCPIDLLRCCDWSAGSQFVFAAFPSTLKCTHPSGNHMILHSWLNTRFI
jgi:hypothetical protein